MKKFAKVIVKGSPITKSNFKLHNSNGRAILPSNTGGYNDRYALYEHEIAYTARVQNPDTVLDEGLIAILKVYYKSEKRHPDTINIPKSIFDGIEKSGLIVNDAQIKKILIEEHYDKGNPRFELELYCESIFSLDYIIEKRDTPIESKIYNPIKKNITDKSPKKKVDKNQVQYKICSICNSKIISEDYITADKGKTYICSKCFKKSFRS